MKIILMLGILIIFPDLLFSQNPVGKGGRIILSYSQYLENASYYIYNPPFAAKAIYQDTIQALNNFPEQLMSSIMSASSQDWVNYNTLGGKKNASQVNAKNFLFIKTMNKDENFFELRSKFSFHQNNSDYCIIKFYLHSTEVDKPKSGAYLLVKDNNKWFTAPSDQSTSQMSLLIMRFQEEKLMILLRGVQTSDALMNELIKKVTQQGALNWTLLYEEFSVWYSQNDKQKIDYFIDPSAW